MQAAPPAGVATRAGLITGLFAGILSLPFITLMRLSGAPGLGFFFLFIALVAYMIAGSIATRRSGLLRSGVGAGALAAAITLFIAICLGIVILALLSPRLAQGLPTAAGVAGRAHRPLARALTRRGAVLWLAVIGSLNVMALGVIGGFLGGLLGRIGRQRQAAAPSSAQADPTQQFAASAPPFTANAAPSTYPSDPNAASYFPPPIPHPNDPNMTPTVSDAGEGQ